jgi:hypothetical protein
VLVSSIRESTTVVAAGIGMADNERKIGVRNFNYGKSH